MLSITKEQTHCSRFIPYPHFSTFSNHFIISGVHQRTTQKVAAHTLTNARDLLGFAQPGPGHHAPKSKQHVNTFWRKNTDAKLVKSDPAAICPSGRVKCILHFCPCFESLLSIENFSISNANKRYSHFLLTPPDFPNIRPAPGAHTTSNRLPVRVTVN